MDNATLHKTRLEMMDALNDLYRKQQALCILREYRPHNEHGEKYIKDQMERQAQEVHGAIGVYCVESLRYIVALQEYLSLDM